VVAVHADTHGVKSTYRDRRWWRHLPVAVFPATLLTAAVLSVWPGIPVASTTDSGSYQATMDAAIAAIT
jgi:hypothetical protein